MPVVSRPARQKSWQIGEEIVSLLRALDAKDTDLGARLRAYAAALGITSDEDAARKVGVSYRQYQRWLSGESEPRARSIRQIAEAFSIPVSDLVGLPDESQLDRIEGTLTALIVELRAAGVIEPAEPVSQAEEVDQLVEEFGQAPAPGADQSDSKPATVAKDDPAKRTK